MLPVKGFGEKKDDGNGLVAVAIDDDKGSQYALKWTVDHLVTKGQTIVLIHVNNKLQTIPNSLGHRVPISEVSEDVASAYRKQVESQTKGLFLPFRCFCTRKDIHCYDVVLEDTNIVKAITDYVARSAIEVLAVGASSHNAFLKKFKATDVPTGLSKAAPDFCTVYVIAKGKISSVRSASRSAPANSPLRSLILSQGSSKPEQMDMHLVHSIKADPSFASRNSTDDIDSIRCPFTRARGSNARPYGEIPLPDTDISFASSGRPSTDHMFPAFYDTMESGRPMRMSNIEDIFDPNRSFESAARLARKSMDTHTTHSSGTEFSTISSSHGTGETTWSSQTMEDVEAEMKRLRLELKQTMDMYATACKEAFTAKQKARDFHTWKMEEDKRLEEARLAEETALAIAEREKAKCKAAIEAAEAAQRIAELEAQKRVNAELKAMKEAEEKRKALDALAHTDVRYRRYTIEEIETATEFFAENRKIGEGGYGPVYRCYLDHTPVAIKVLRPDAAQGRSQFQQEVEVLSCIRHPNMVLLLGACPEYGCLVYEYMANGSLEDQLFRRDDTPVLSWQLRFRIAAEIATGLLFLHQAKPEPLVHRDLKPGNILLDRNYVSKISDVGLARLVPPSVANNVTQYRMTSTAGTFCYIDPEYQQTGMLGTKSDVYSLGIMLLQIITAKPPMGITHHVERSIEKGTFAEILDPVVPDWPLEETLCFAKIALKCAELRRKDRPDLGTVILPELNRLRAIAEENMHYMLLPGNTNHSPNHSQVFSRQDVISDPLSGYESIKSRSSMSSYMGQRP